MDIGTIAKLNKIVSICEIDFAFDLLRVIVDCEFSIARWRSLRVVAAALVEIKAEIGLVPLLQDLREEDRSRVTEVTCCYCRISERSISTGSLESDSSLLWSKFVETL